ncbi:MAG TPA: rRNA maturation RNase YbeY [Phycisphaerae bacterium]|nr:rRNA maturation RNase YbeY [Phycisphaerae bacterium]
MAKLPFQISIDAGSGSALKADLAAPLRKILKLLQVNACRWNILLVGDQEMRKLHRRHLQDPTTTDVLTFDMREDPQSDAVELDTVLCIDEARRRADELGHPVENELLLYALHSLLHVRGHDDVTPAQAARMHQREDEILAMIGVGPVYHWQSNGAHRAAANRKSRALPAAGKRKSAGRRA